MKGFYISAIKRSSGKTTISIAITRLLVNMGFSVATFKKGPDYIDPMWLSMAAKRQCYNIDFFFHKKNIKHYFFEKAGNADYAIVESNHGLFDDVGLTGRKSNAELSKILGLPVILVIDVSELGRSVVPIILGCQQFDEDLKIAGIILNRVQNERHKQKLNCAIKKYLKVPIVGILPEDKNIKIEQRHLGLSAHLSGFEMDEKVEFLSTIVKPYIDLDKIISSASDMNTYLLNFNVYKEKRHNRIVSKKKIGICFDRAFNFYYSDNLEIIKKNGCELVYISPLKDEVLPALDYLYIGGGFPELLAGTLEKNYKFKESLYKQIENGLNVYAECGGLIYLVDELIYKDKTYKMLGILKAKAKFQEKPVAHGYTILKGNDNLLKLFPNCPFYLRGHEFHHFYLEELEHYDFAYKVLRGKGIKDGFDGILYKNVLASFSHIYDNEENSLFISFFNR